MSKTPQHVFELVADLCEVTYRPLMTKDLDVYGITALKRGKLSSVASFNLRVGGDVYGFSQWVSPKRTRTFPYARVYDTLGVKNRVTLIPFCKDEGADGDRDYIQWDTISLMSLLNVHVIIGYYVSAEKNTSTEQVDRHKITNQKYNYAYVASQIEELRGYQSSALHWNLAQIAKLHEIANLTCDAYRKISKKTGVQMHSEQAMKRRIETIMSDVDKFKAYSRELAREAQSREISTLQPKESVVGNKATIHLKNLLGGEYFLTADECEMIDDVLFLIEKKHSAKKKIPSQSDIKDAYIKMALFSNISRISKLTDMDEEFSYRAAIGLTSETIHGTLHSNMGGNKIDVFARKNSLSENEKNTVKLMIKEAKENNFALFIVNSKNLSQRKKILRELI